MTYINNATVYFTTSYCFVVTRCVIAPIFMHGSIIACFNQFLVPMSASNAW